MPEDADSQSNREVVLREGKAAAVGLKGRGKAGFLAVGGEHGWRRVGGGDVEPFFDQFGGDAAGATADFKDFARTAAEKGEERVAFGEVFVAGEGRAEAFLVVGVSERAKLVGRAGMEVAPGKGNKIGEF